MSVLSLAQLLVAETQTAIYDRAIALAKSALLPVTSWAPGDPTRSLYHLLSTTLANAEATIAGYIAAGFLDYSEGDWLILLAKQVYNVDAIGESYATCTCRITNAGGRYFEFDPGDITVKKSGSTTYHNTTGGVLIANGTLDLDFVADVSGSAGSATVGEITEMVTALLGLSVVNTTAAVGVDRESDESIRIRCRAKLGALSPNGPADSYNYIATSTVSSVTRAKTIGDHADGSVDVYVASSSGVVQAGDVALIQSAIAEQATPQCVTAVVHSATAKTVTVNYNLWIYDAVGETQAAIKSKIASALDAMFLARPIGGDVIPGNSGKIYLSLISRTIEAVYPNHAYRVEMLSPTSDTTLAVNEVAVLSHDPANSTVTLVAQ